MAAAIHAREEELATRGDALASGSNLLEGPSALLDTASRLVENGTIRSVTIGRHGELQAVRGFLSDAAAPAALVLAGDAGIGKTTVWRAAAADAAAVGADVLSTRPSQTEAPFAFAALGDLFDGRQEVLADVPAPQRSALEAALLLAEQDVEVDTRVVATATLSALRALAARAPVVVAVDDVQWLDPASAAVLAFAARRIGSDPIRFLLVTRVEAPVPLGLDPDDVVTVEIGPLAFGAVQRLLRERLRTSFPRPVLRRVYEASAGNALYALELARALQRRGGAPAPGEPLPVPASLEALVDERLGEIDRRTRDLLLEVAALGEAAVDVVETDSLLHAVEAGILELEGDRLRFAHPILAAAVYGGADPLRRRAVHARLADGAATLEERARHLALSAEPPSATIADALDRAARDALRRGAPPAAGDMLEHAAAFTPPSDEALRERRLLSAADAYNRGGDGERARRIAEHVRRTSTSARTRAEAAVWLADAVRSVASADAAVAEAAGHDDLLARALNARAESLLQAGDVACALDSARAAVRAARGGGGGTTLVRALAHTGFLAALHAADGADEALREAVELERACDEDLFFSPNVARAVTRIWADDVEGARIVLERRLSTARAAGDDLIATALGVHLVKVEVRAGRLDVARRLAEDMLDVREAGGWPERPSETWAHALVCAHLGELDEAKLAAESALSTASRVGDGLFASYCHALLGFVALSAGDTEAALVHLEPLQQLLAEIGIRDPGFLAASGDELDALVAAGRTEQARRRIAEVEAVGRRLARPRELVAASRARGVLENDLASVRRALAECDGLPVPLERGRTLLALGIVHRRLRQRSAARDAFGEARDTFTAIGAGAWVARADDEMARLGGRTPAGRTLTATEHRVAQLAARGLTTKQIAVELTVSPKTVEKHLTSVYAKLGVSTRASLAHRFAGAV